VRDTRARVLKNTSALLLNQAILVVSSFAITIPLARLWGAELFGRYAFAVAFPGLFTFAFDWGLNQLLTREVARNRDSVAKYLNNALGLTLVFSLVTMALLILSINLLDYPSETVLAVYLSGLWTLLGVLASLFIRGTFYAFQKMEYETAPLLAERLLAVGLGLAVVIARRGLIALMLVLVASRVVKLGACIVIYTRRIARPGIEFDWSFWRNLTRSALPFGLTLAFGLVYAKVDITLLSLLTGNESEIGYYRAALAATMYFPVMGLALTNSLFPVMSGLYLSGRESFVHNYRRSVGLLFAVGLPIALGLFLLGDRFVDLVYGQQFTPSVISLRILSLSVLMKFIHTTLAMVLTASNRQGLRTAIIACAALANVVLNCLLIPWRGAVGASVAAVLTDCLLLATCYFFVSRQLGGVSLWATLARPTLSAVAMGAVILLLRRTSLLLLIPSAAAIYGAVLFALGGLPRDELVRLKAMLPVRLRRGVSK